jgi:hypothetical protein
MEVWLDVGRGKKSQRAKLCAPGGQIHELKIDGYLKRAWLDVVGKPVTFYLANPRDAAPRLKFTLTGSWQGR